MLKKLLLFALAHGVSSQMLQAQIKINEVMQSNIDCIMDDLNEFPDSWVELYNAGTESVDLSQFLIGTKEDGSNAWRMSALSAAPGSYTLVYCDKASTEMHTSFRLESGKDCRVFIFNNNLSIIDSLHIVDKQPDPNISYGRKSIDSEEWGYQYTPTPNAANCGVICSEVLGNPIFSEPGRVMTTDQTIDLTLTLPEETPEGTVIRYTTNGDEPTTSSMLYTAPIQISSNQMIRAKLFCSGYLSPRATTHSYLFLGREMKLPVVSIVSKNAYFKDNKIGILAWGTYDTEKRNYQFDWRRPINFEFFTEADSTSELNMLCETRVAGGVSRINNKLKTLAVYTHNRFGHKHFKYQFWPDQRPGKTHYKSFLLRDAGNDFDYLYMRDAIMQRSMAQNADMDWQAWRPAIIYINGEYIGILNLRERSNEDNIYSNYDGLEDIDMIENWHLVKKGSFDNFEQFQNFYKAVDNKAEDYDQWLDVSELLNLYIMNLFYSNQDWPGNNTIFWRPREEGGIWRVVAKDTDLGLGHYHYSNTYKTLEWFWDPNYDPDRSWANFSNHTKLFRRLARIDEFNKEFIDRTAVYMGDFLNFDAIWTNIWGPMYEMIKDEYPIHRALYNPNWPIYADELAWAQNWLKGRPDQFYQQFSEFFDLGAPVPLYINQNAEEDVIAGVDITMNGIKLTKPTFNGKFYVGREVILSAAPSTDAEGLPHSTRTVTSWEVRIYSSEGSHTTQTYNGSTCQFIMPSGYQVKVSPRYGEQSGLEEFTNNPGTPAFYYDLNGRQLDKPHTGINIVRQNNGQTNKLIITE